MVGTVYEPAASKKQDEVCYSNHKGWLPKCCMKTSTQKEKELCRRNINSGTTLDCTLLLFLANYILQDRLEIKDE